MGLMPIKEEAEELVSSLSATQEFSHLQPRRRLSPERDRPGTLISDIQLLEL